MSAYESTVSPLLAIAALCAVCGAAALLLAVELPSWGRVRLFVYDHTPRLMLLVAATATGASLYYSESVGFIPCEFCWYQRIAMYPLFALLAMAAVTRARIEPRYLLVFAVVGLGLSIYHYQLQMFGSQPGVCSGPVSCSGKYVQEFGRITIPFMAGCGFLTILLLQVAEWRVEYLFRAWSAEDAVEPVNG